MTTTKYLEINSTYRNRSIWPNPAHFETLVAQSGQRNAVNASDPVSLAMPIANGEWIANNFQNSALSTSTVNGTIFTTGIGAANSPNVIVFSTAPNSLHVADDYYSHAVVTTGAMIKSRIVSYTYMGNNIGMATIDPPLNLVNGDTITISDPTDFSTNRVFVPMGSDAANAYVNYILYNETNQMYQTITGYDNVTGTLTTSGSFAGWNMTDVLSIRKEIPLSTGTAGALSTSSSVILNGPVIVSPIVGSFIKIRLPFANGIIPTDTRRITSYDSTTNTVTVFPPFTLTAAGSAYEILSFSYDNFTPFVYTGTQQTEQLIYEIKLNSLVLPNSIMTSGGNGGTISQYPFVYVELSPLDYSTTNLLASNNPNATRVLFRASYCNYDNVDPSKPFVHFIGNEMVQRVKFFVETNLRFRVTLPNGELFTTGDVETISPQAPNSMMQLSALFEIKRDSSSYFQRI